MLVELWEYRHSTLLIKALNLCKKTIRLTKENIDAGKRFVRTPLKNTH